MKRSNAVVDRGADPDAKPRWTPPPEAGRIVFAPLAWLKLQWLCHRGQTEVGAFGIGSESDPLRIQDVRTVRQRCTGVSVAFDDAAVADFFDEQVDAGLRPERFARVWVHTHPADSAEPSAVDERTFDRVFGVCHWAVMFILAKGGAVTCRLRVSLGSSRLSVTRPLAVCVDYSDATAQLAALDTRAWEREYTANVHDALGPDSLEFFEQERRGSEPVDALLDWFGTLDHSEREAFLTAAARVGPEDESEDPHHELGDIVDLDELVDERAADPAREVLDAE